MNIDINKVKAIQSGQGTTAKEVVWLAKVAFFALRDNLDELLRNPGNAQGVSFKKSTTKTKVKFETCTWIHSTSEEKQQFRELFALLSSNYDVELVEKQVNYKYSDEIPRYTLQLHMDISYDS